MKSAFKAVPKAMGSEAGRNREVQKKTATQNQCDHKKHNAGLNRAKPRERAKSGALFEPSATCLERPGR
jgi:hypothetical protein